MAPRVFRAIAARLRSSDGFALAELLVVMVVLGIVITPTVAAFTSNLNQEVDQSRREQAYARARLALQRMRADIHCSGGVTSVDQNPSGGFTLTLTEAHQGQDGWCPVVIPAGDLSTGVQWCTVPADAAASYFVLYRFLGTDSSLCGAGGASTFVVDYIAVPPGGWPATTKAITPPTSFSGNIWPDPVSCPAGYLPTVAIDLSVALDPVGHPNERYELRDEIALRNANRCV
jgi:prepilin-type N-terminal cleavage/methylation domain-containing protein